MTKWLGVRDTKVCECTNSLNYAVRAVRTLHFVCPWVCKVAKNEKGCEWNEKNTDRFL